MELLLSSLTSELHKSYPEINIMELRSKIASVLINYEIKPINLDETHCDLLEKIELFLSAKKLEGLSKNTISNYRLELDIFARKVFKSVSEITTNDLRNYLGQFDHLKISSLAKRLSVLKSFFSWLEDEEIINKSPAKKIKPPKNEKRIPKSLTIGELEMVREACQTLRERTLFEVFYATGARLSEIYNANIDDINWQNMSLNVVGKGNKEREVYLNFKACYYLKKYLNSRRDDNPALFVTKRKPKKRLGKRSIEREIAKIGERAGIKNGLHPHRLRHSLATSMLNNGADITAIQSILGHSSLDTTQVYAQLTDRNKKEQYNRFVVQ